MRVQGEVEFEVPPLDGAEAVALFCARSGLAPSSEIMRLCARLDALPLAVELAARTKALTPAQILSRLVRRLDMHAGPFAGPKPESMMVPPGARRSDQVIDAAPELSQY